MSDALPSKNLPQPPLNNVSPENRRIYRNDPKFLDRKVLINSADPDQAAPRGVV